MRLSFHGAAGEVTGSCTLLDTGRSRILIDFGLHQGGPSAERRNRRLPDIDYERLDAVVLTHAHLDHSGRLPLLVRAGFRGRIWATPASIQLTDLLLKDAAAIQEMDAYQTTAHRERIGRRPAEPLYTVADVAAVMRLMSPLPYAQATPITDDIALRFTDAGHILGSASVELRIRQPGGDKVVVHSADIGGIGAPLLNDPVPPALAEGGIARADVVILESTYGDRDHQPIGNTIEELVGIITAARDGDGKVLIPAFAIGRTQNLIYYLGELYREGRLRGVQVYIDSPMAIAATELYRQHRTLFDEPARTIIENGDTPLNVPTLRYTRTGDESRSLNRMGGGAVVISASGMLTGGRIMHHLKHNIWKPQTHLVFVGFQPEGSLGRRLIDGERHATILREHIQVKAQIHTLGGLSAHAGQSGLLNWARHYTGGAGQSGRPRFILTHGEDPPRHALAKVMKTQLGASSLLPVFNETIEI
jgi:metallo-beta-lactamase family protein